MAHIKKAWLICDSCKKQLEIDPSVDDPFNSSFAMRDKNYKDWGRVQETQILCPDCLRVYNEEKQKAEKRLKEIAGIETFNIIF